MKRLFGLLGILVLVSLGATRVEAQTTSNGYYYHVQAGDTWFSISRASGYSVQTLQAMNPQAVRPYDLLYRKDALLIPADFTVTGPQHHVVESGDTWLSVATRYEISVQYLQATNPDALDILTIGTRLFYTSPGTRRHGYCPSSYSFS